MDPARFQKMKAAFERNGGEIDLSEEAVAEMLLNDPSNLAVTHNARYIVMTTNPSTTTVFEEFIHTAQHRTGRYDQLVKRIGHDRATIKLEIDAQEKLLRNARSWGIPVEEIKTIQVRLAAFQALDR